MPKKISTYKQFNKMGNICCGENNKNAMIRNKVCMKSAGNTKIGTLSTQETNFSDINELEHLKLSDERFLAVRKISKLGKGGQGIVYLVSLPTDNETGPKKHLYAMKKIAVKKNQHHAVQTQILLSSSLRSPFICPLNFYYIDSASNYYLFFNLQEGGDLFTYLGFLDEQMMKFIMAGVILALQFMHQSGFVHRDIKIENILLDKDGYPLITDFGMSQYQSSTVSQMKLKGTISYLAPQLLQNRELCDRGLDLWALGITLQYLAFLEYPYTKHDIIDGNFKQKCEALDKRYNRNSNRRSQELKDLINNLLRVNKQDRLGYNGFDQLKKHNFFNGIEWDKIKYRQVESPLKELVAGNSPLLKHTII